MIRVGIAGIGFMGMIHYLTYQKRRNAQVVALCEQNEKRLAGDWTDIKGNFGPPGERMDLAGIATYRDLDEMLADSQVDAVDITLPPALHADIAVAALEAGKHVFCEKPMALDPNDCHRMAAAADASGKQLLIGHVLPFFPEYAWALREVRGGEHGRLLGGSFRRVISDPTWLTQYWNADVIGGPMLDLHVHDAHFIRLLFGMPTAVSTCGRARGGLAEHWTTQFEFSERDLAVTATSGVINQQGRSFNHGFEIHLERAILVFEFAVLGDEGRYLCEPTCLDDSGQAVQAELSGGDPLDAFASEIGAVVEGFETGRPPAVLAADLALDAIQLCQRQTESLVEHRTVRIET